MMATTLIWPGLDPGAEPPTSRTSQHTVTSWHGSGDWHTSAVVDSPQTVLVGADWSEAAEVQVRARGADGWGSWMDLRRHADHAGDADHDDHEVDPDQDEATGSEPVWTGPSDAFQLRATGAPEVSVTAVHMSGPDGLAYAPGSSGAGAAHADAHDQVISRDAWDPAGECRPNVEPEYAEQVSVGVVHHTHIFPDYAPEEADDLIRAICLYHVGDRGFDDIAYNLLIDRYGVVYEGREGGVDRPVVGAHAAGFNDVSFGVAVVGDFQDNDVPQAAVDSLDRVLAWKFSMHGIDPHAAHEVVSTGGSTPGLTAYPEGSTVTLPSIIGHRDTSSDSLCPGRFLYARLTGAADRVQALMDDGVRFGFEPSDGGTAGPAGGVVAIQPAGPPAGGVGLMAAPADWLGFADDSGTPTWLIGLTAIGLGGLAVAGRRPR